MWSNQQKDSSIQAGCGVLPSSGHFAAVSGTVAWRRRGRGWLISRTARRIHVFAKGVSPRLWEGLRGWCSLSVAKIPWGSWLQTSDEQDCNAIPVVRVHPIHEAVEDDGAGGSGHILINCDRESFIFMAGLPLGLRGSCAANTSAAVVPVVNGSIAVA